MLIGHQKQFNFLKKAAAAKMLSHAYLFSGQEKLGKKTLALQWISDFLGKNFNQNHPDLIFIKPQAKEIQVFQIKELIWKFSLKPSLSPVKIAIIDDAHLMNQEAQTCLLKTLEEPKGNTLLILISNNVQNLFPTIISRVQVIRFNSVKKEEIEKSLLARGLSEKKADEISEISLGRPGIALDLVLAEDKLKKFGFIEELCGSPLYFRFQYAKNLSEDLQKTKETLDIWMLYLRKKLIWAITNQQPTLKTRKILKSLQKTNFLMSGTNINARLALEMLMIELN